MSGYSNQEDQITKEIPKGQDTIWFPYPNKLLQILIITGMLYYQLSSNVMKNIATDNRGNMLVDTFERLFQSPNPLISFTPQNYHLLFLLIIQLFLLSLLGFSIINYIKIAIYNKLKSGEVMQNTSRHDPQTVQSHSNTDKISLRNFLFYTKNGIQFHSLLSLFVILLHFISTTNYIYRNTSFYFDGVVDYYSKIIGILILTFPIWGIIILRSLIQYDQLKYLLQRIIPLLLIGVILTTIFTDIIFLTLFGLTITSLLISAVTIRLCRKIPKDNPSSKYLISNQKFNSIDEITNNHIETVPKWVKLGFGLTIFLQTLAFGGIYYDFIKPDNYATHLITEARSQATFVTLILYILPLVIAPTLRRFPFDRLRSFFKQTLILTLPVFIWVTMNPLVTMVWSGVIFFFSSLFFSIILPCVIMSSLLMAIWMIPNNKLTHVLEKDFDIKHSKLFIEV